MGIDLKDNKGNMVNNSIFSKNVQNNVEMNTNIVTDIKTGPLALFNAWIGNMTLDYIANYQIKKQNVINSVNRKAIENIPESNLVEPRINIVGPTLDGLKYNLDEEYIKEMFSNLLVSELDDRKQNKVLPAYIEIVKQLSVEDASFLKTLSSIGSSQKFLTYLSIKDELRIDKSYRDLGKIVILDSQRALESNISPNNVVFDNLSRLEIIKLKSGEYLPNDKDVAKKVFETLKKQFISRKDYDEKISDIVYHQGVLEITDFGKQFIEICCS